MEDIVSARGIALLLALCIGVSLHPNLAWSQGAPQGSSDVNPIGKVLTAEGAIRIEHPAAIVVQANLPTGEQTRSAISSIAATSSRPDPMVSSARRSLMAARLVSLPMRAWK